MGLISPGGDNLLDFLELRQVLSTYDGDHRDPLWWPQERPVPMRVAREPFGISLPSMPGPKTLCGALHVAGMLGREGRSTACTLLLLHRFLAAGSNSVTSTSTFLFFGRNPWASLFWHNQFHTSLYTPTPALGGSRSRPPDSSGTRNGPRDLPRQP